LVWFLWQRSFKPLVVGSTNDVLGCSVNTENTAPYVAERVCKLGDDRRHPVVLDRKPDDKKAKSNAHTEKQD
jgi:hypothetical protein